MLLIVPGSADLPAPVDAYIDGDHPVLLGKLLGLAERPPPWNDGDFGGNFSKGADYAWFSSPEFENDVGYILIHKDGRVSLNPSWGSISDSDKFAGGSGTSTVGQISWLLHRPIETSEIPIPPALWLFGSGLIGLIAIARRK